MLKRDARGDVVIAARLRPGEHDAQIEWLDGIAGENPGRSTQSILVWIIDQVRGDNYSINVPYSEHAAQEALKRVDQRTHHLEELVTELVGQIRAGGGQRWDAEVSPDEGAEEPDVEDDAGRQNVLSARMAGLNFNALKR